VELIQAGGKTLLPEIHKLVNSIWNKEELPDLWKKSVIVPIYKKGDKTDCCNDRGISLLSSSYIILRIISLGFDTTDQVLISFLCSSDTGEKIGVERSST
jgi:hypothetical protein